MTAIRKHILLILFSLGLSLLVFLNRPQPQASPPVSLPAPATPASEVDCKEKILAALEDNSQDGLTYQVQDGAGSWNLTGISGKMRTFQWDSYRNGPVFDLVQVYTRAQTRGYPLWAAAGVRMPAHYTVHDSASYQTYFAQGHGDQPYYLSFVAGLSDREQIQQAFDQPGGQKVQLSIAGEYVSERGIDWKGCEPVDSDYCWLAQFFESLEPAFEDGLYGESNNLIKTGSASATPLEGFLIWPMEILQPLDLCQAAGFDNKESSGNLGEVP